MVLLSVQAQQARNREREREPSTGCHSSPRRGPSEVGVVVVTQQQVPEVTMALARLSAALTPFASAVIEHRIFGAFDLVHLVWYL